MSKNYKEVSEIVGLDWGDRYSQFCRVSRQGEIVERGDQRQLFFSSTTIKTFVLQPWVRFLSFLS
jgi:hypothetical protein